jgi:hypothetical protein
MKKMILCALVVVSLAVQAQTTKAGDSNPFRLTHTGSYAAKQEPTGYFIADPVTRALMEGTNGADIRKNSEIAGVSKRAYGFANGFIMLRSSGAATSGTVTGSGSVGTGTTPGAAGMHGAGIGVNGKNPYAGVGISGTALTGKGINVRDNEAPARNQAP